MSKIDILKVELTADPLGRGYAAMGDRAAAISMNTVDIPDELDAISGSQLFNALEPTEFVALTTQQAQSVRDVFGLGQEIDVRAGTNTRKVLLSAFGVGTATRMNLQALTAILVSRAAQLRLGAVSIGDVMRARA